MTRILNPLNAELNPICCFLALLGAHHFLHVSRIRVKESRLSGYKTQLLEDFKAFKYHSQIFLVGFRKLNSGLLLSVPSLITEQINTWESKVICTK
jgi:hypothetical protein